MLAQLDQLVDRFRVQGIARRQQTDDGEHDQPDALLTIIGPVRKARRGARQNQQRAGPS